MDITVAVNKIESLFGDRLWDTCYCEAWQTLKAAVLAQQRPTTAITPPEDRDCDTCANDGECYVTMLQCKGYVRAAQ